MSRIPRSADSDEFRCDNIKDQNEKTIPKTLCGSDEMPLIRGRLAVSRPVGFRPPPACDRVSGKSVLTADEVRFLAPSPRKVGSLPVILSRRHFNLLWPFMFYPYEVQGKSLAAILLMDLRLFKENRDESASLVENYAHSAENGERHG